MRLLRTFWHIREISRWLHCQQRDQWNIYIMPHATPYFRRYMGYITPNTAIYGRSVIVFAFGQSQRSFDWALWSHVGVAGSKFYPHFVVVILVLNFHWIVCSWLIEVLPRGERVLGVIRERCVLTIRATCLVDTTWVSKTPGPVEVPGQIDTKSLWKFVC